MIAVLHKEAGKELAMTWSLHYDEGASFAECKFNGVTSAKDFGDITARCAALQKEKGVLGFLLNTLETEFDAMNGDLYQLPSKEYPALNVDKRTRLAVIRPKSEKAVVLTDFYVLACTNRYWKAQGFVSREEAINWLKE
jgi:hypothetical protein